MDSLHPDTTLDWQSLKAIKRGGKQAADDQAMDEYWLAIESGKSKDEAGEVFIRTYQKVISTNSKKYINV